MSCTLSNMLPQQIGASQPQQQPQQPYCAAPNPFNCNYFSPELQPEIEQEQEGYLPPDPALYNFYSADQQFMQMPQQPRYTFLRRINKMNWDLLANVDVGTIARNGDVASVEFLMQPIAFANITQDDIQQFGTRSALHAFLILQMAVEILLGKLNNACPQVQQQVPQPQVPPQQIAQYEARINLLNKDIQARDMMITNLTEKLKFAERSRDEAIGQLQKNYKNPLNVNIQQKDDPINKSKISPIRSNNETGELHFDTEYYEYLQERPDIYPHKRSHRKSSVKHDNSSRHKSRSSISSSIINSEKHHYKSTKDKPDQKRKKKPGWD